MRVIPKLFTEKVRDTIISAPINDWFIIDMENRSISDTRSTIVHCMRKANVNRGFKRLTTKVREGVMYARFVPLEETDND